MKHVAIACSYKFEDLNLLLEVLKLNFENPPIIHVFCNFNSKDFEKHTKIINYSLIDDFHHIPDDKCYVANTDRDTKRRQPLRMFQKVVRYMSSIEKNFVFLEGDNFPLIEKSFYEPLQNLKQNEFIANLFHFDKVNTSNFTRKDHVEVIDISASQMNKMPFGYILPSPMYIGYTAAKKMADYIDASYPTLLDGKKNFEGCLGTICANTDIERTNVSDYFCFSYPKLNQIDPVSYVLHHHNILNLKNIFREYGIYKGETVKLIFENNQYHKKVENIDLVYENLNFEVCTLYIPKEHLL